MSGARGALATLATLATVAVAGLLGACGGEPTGLAPTAPPQLAGGAAAGGGGARTLDPALVGSWSRSLLLAADRANVVATETRWTFLADGRAERRVATSNLALDVVDQLVTPGEWTTEGNGTLVVRFGAGAGERYRAPYRVEARLDGARLVLDGLVFLRLVP